MDPLTALSTASAVVQLVDFGRRILDDTHELYTQGRLVTLQELKTTTQDLVHVNHLLAHRPQPGDNAASPISDAEQVSSLPAPVLIPKRDEDSPSPARHWTSSLPTAAKRQRS